MSALGVRPKVGLWLAIIGVLLHGTAFAQTNRNGSIEGTIRDNTGAALPGVTITVTSPALQTPEVVRVSQNDGTYQFLDLPVGTYTITYELTGFSKLVREDIRLTAAFAARVDISLELAGVQETLTVRGQSPLVDVTNTRGGTTVTQELVSSTPANLNYQDMMALVSGVVVNREIPLSSAIAGTNLGSGNNLTYGQNVRMGNWVEGIKAAQALTPDFLATEEMDVKTFGNTAEIDLPGSNIQFVYKSGANTFHGRFSLDYQGNGLTADNLDDSLRKQGITSPNTAKWLYQTGGDIGGRIVANKLWFYASLLWGESRRSFTGFVQNPGADGVYFTPDDVASFPKLWGFNRLGKVTYQASQSSKFVIYGESDPVYDEVKSVGTVNRFIPYEAQRQSQTWTTLGKVEWQGVLSPRLFTSMMLGYSGYKIIYRPHDDLAITPCRFYRDTGLYLGNGCGGFVGTGLTGSATAPQLDRSPRRIQWSGNATYNPQRSLAGNHSLTAGYLLDPGRISVSVPDAHIANEYLLVYDRTGAGAYQPTEFWASDVPTFGAADQNVFGTWIADSWRPAPRLTVNAGLRWERMHAYVENTTKQQGPFGFSGTFPQVDIGTWSGFAPRIGGALDLAGNGKTVVKATYGRYNHSEFNNFSNPLTFPTPWNKNSPSVYSYLWHANQACTSLYCTNTNYVPGSVNLDVNGPDFLGVSGPANNLVNPDLQWGVTHEATASLERELVPNVAVRGLYVYKKVTQETAAQTFINIARPYSVYNQQFTRTDPGPDGVVGTADDGGPVTVYDYDPAYRGAKYVANELPNVPDNRSDSYHNIEVALTRRPGTGKWYANTSYLATKNHRWLVAVPQSPNDNLFPLDTTWTWMYRLAGGYDLPAGVTVSSLYQMFSGTPAQRTTIFRAVDPSGGPRFPSSSTITLRMEQYGAESLPIRNLLNLRVAKKISLGAGTRLTLDVDTFNVLNSNVGYTATYVSGPTFGYLTTIAEPRAVRFGATLEY